MADLRQLIGGGVSGLGTRLGLPEFNISELISGAPSSSQSFQPGPMTFLPPQMTPIPGSELVGQSTPQGSEFYFAPPIRPPATSTTGGGGGGGATSREEQLRGTDRNPDQEREYQELLRLRREAGERTSAEEEINRSFGPQIQYLDEAKREFERLYGEEEKGIEERFAEETGRIPTARAREEQALGLQEQSIGRQVRSALDQAIRSYNALRQQRGARFGAGSSAGEAVGELAAREFARASGQIGERGVEATQQINLQKQRIGDFFTQKEKDLQLQKGEALKEANRLLQQGLLQISQNRSMTESAKAQLRLSLIQDALNQRKQLDALHDQFRGQLVALSAQKFAEISGRPFTRQEIDSFVSQALGGIPAATTLRPTGASALIGSPFFGRRSPEEEALLSPTG